MASNRYSAQVVKSWNTAYNACLQLYEYDKLDKCIAVAQRHLKDDSMPLYHRMLFELILAGSIGSWWEAGDHFRRCEGIWQNTHAHHQNDADELVQDSLADIRQLLDNMKREHDLKPRSMEDPRLAEYEEEEEDDPGEQDEQVEDYDIMEGEEYVVDEDWESEEIPMMEPGESEDIGEVDADEEKGEDAIMELGERDDARETMEVESTVKPEVERIPSEMVEGIGETMQVDSTVKLVVERRPLETLEVDADAKRSMPSVIVKVEDAKSVVKPSSKARESKMDMMSGGSGLDDSAKKKQSLASRAQQLLKKTKSTMGSKGKSKDKEAKKRSSAMDLTLRWASKVSSGFAIFYKGRQEGQPRAT
jgi:hypothetical protein